MKIIKFVIIAILVTNIFIPGTLLEASDYSSSNNQSKNRLIVKFKNGTNLTSFNKKHSGYLKSSSRRLKSYTVRFDSNISLNSKLEELKKDPNVEFCQIDYNYNLLENPDDTYLNYQWGLSAINAPKAWDVSTPGQDIIVAVLDTGVDLDHPDLSGNLIQGSNLINSSKDANDDNGHGTHVSGIMGAIINNGMGIAGVSGNIKIMPVKVLDSLGEGYSSDVSDGIVWAVDNGAKIINLSLGGDSYDSYLKDAITYATNKGVLIVAAAGNDNTEAPQYPASFDNVIAISAIDNNLNKASFSNFGDYIDLTAPGYGIYSTILSGKYGYMSGTSMATPFISGAASLLWSQNPSLTPMEIEEILESTARDLGVPGKDKYFGNGLVDLYQALESVEIQNLPLPESTNYTFTPTPIETPITTTPSPDYTPTSTNLATEAIYQSTPANTPTPAVTPISSSTITPIGTPNNTATTTPTATATANVTTTPAATATTNVTTTPTSTFVYTPTYTPTNTPASLPIPIDPGISNPIQIPDYLPIVASTPTITSTYTLTPTIMFTQTPTIPATPTIKPTPEETGKNSFVRNDLKGKSDISIIIRGSLINSEVPPFIDDNNRTMVPVRFISEHLGAVVKWDSKTKNVTIIKNDLIVGIRIGDNYLINNGKKITMDTRAIIKDNRTFIPIRAIATALGENVGWDNSTYSVIIGE